MKNILLIDDLAHKGWKSILEKAIVKNIGNIDIATNYNDACIAIKSKVDLIFLDVRLTEEDHNKKDISEMSGFQILKKIKENFTSTNFSTPIILMTASNKIWIIEEFRQNGIDAFYIKEHPSSGFDKDSSRENLERLQNNFQNLILKSAKRNEVWQNSVNIIEKLNTHKYFNESSGYTNVKERIIDKLKLGYSYLFNEQTKIEKQILKSDNESLAFIIYWSILEEIAKGFSEKNNWEKLYNYSFSGNWKFRNNKTFIVNNDDNIIVEPVWNGKENISKEFEFTHNGESKYEKGHINLSEQILVLLYHYGINEDNGFIELNKYRNKIDYIHSSIKAIYEKPVIKNSNQKNAYDKTVELLSLVNEILNYPK